MTTSLYDDDRSLCGQLNGRIERARAMSGRRHGHASPTATTPESHAHDRRQHAVVKVSYVKMNTTQGMAKARAHLAYLERDGVARDGGPAAFFNQRGPVERAQLWSRSEHDPHQFRIIISPELGHKMDLERVARHFVRDMERQVGSKLDWGAVAHYNTDHPHVHIIVRGTAMDGLDVRFGKNYIAHGMREVVRDLATIELGERNNRHRYEQQRREIQQTAYTGLDRALERCADDARRVDMNEGLLDRDAELRRNALERLRALERRELATHIERGVWQLAPHLHAELQEHQRAQDIQRRLAEAKCNPLQTDLGKLAPDEQLHGKLIARGLADEASGDEYIVVMQRSGVARYVELKAGDEPRRAHPGEIITARATADQTIIQTHGTLEAQIKALHVTWLDQQSHAPNALHPFDREIHSASRARRAELERCAALTRHEHTPSTTELARRLAHIELNNWLAAEQERRRAHSQKPLVMARDMTRFEGHVRSEPVQLHGSTFLVVEGRERDMLVPYQHELWTLRGQRVEGQRRINPQTGTPHLVIKPARDNEHER
jgi:type IV secretory pathway VirD2 relaxase